MEPSSTVTSVFTILIYRIAITAVNVLVLVGETQLAIHMNVIGASPSGGLCVCTTYFGLVLVLHLPSMSKYYFYFTISIRKLAQKPH